MQDFLNNRKHILNDDYYNLRQYHCFIRNKFSNDVDCEISNLIKTVNKNNLYNYKNHLKNKLKKLFKDSKWCFYSNYNKNVVNSSSYTPNFDERLALDYGMKFATSMFKPIDLDCISSLIRVTRDNNDDFSYLTGLILGASSQNNDLMYCWPKRLNNALKNLKK